MEFLNNKLIGEESADGAKKPAEMVVINVTKKANKLSGTGVYKKTGNVSKKVMFKLNTKSVFGPITYKSNTSKVKVAANGKVTIAKNFTGIGKITAVSAEDAFHNKAKKIITVKVTPGKMMLKKAANAKKRAMVLTWKKMAGADKYQIRMATNKKMKKGKKTINVKGAAAYKKVTGLKKGKKYFVQIRAYDKQTKAWGSWGAAKKVVIKK